MTSIDSILGPRGLNLPEQPLTVSEAEDWIQHSCFTPGPSGRIGLELELLVGRAGDPSLKGSLSDGDYQEFFEGLKSARVNGNLTLEPGGQFEFSSLPKDSLPKAIQSVHQSMALLRGRAAELGFALTGAGVDPFREPRRITQAPRYSAMEEYFRPWGQAGSIMMCSTASLQINIEAGTSDAEMRDRWDLLYALGPTLAATFANSSWFRGRRTGWKSKRLAAWLALDRSRTGVPYAEGQSDPATAYTQWALDAPLMMLRRPHGSWKAPLGLTFRDWLLEGRTAVPDLPPASLEDLQHHLSTLFPHVRPRGYFEVRYIDAQPGCWWAVPAAVIAALVSDRRIAEHARDICADSPTWEDAACFGLENPITAVAAVKLLTLAALQLQCNPATALFARQVEEYLERWTIHGRSPADDHPSEWGKHAHGCAQDSCVVGA